MNQLSLSHRSYEGAAVNPAFLFLRNRNVLRQTLAQPPLPTSVSTVSLNLKILSITLIIDRYYSSMSYRKKKNEIGQFYIESWLKKFKNPHKYTRITSPNESKLTNHKRLSISSSFDETKFFF